MAPELNDAPQVETAATPQDQTTAQPESQAGVITNTAAPTAAQLADAEREFDEFYSDAPAPAPAEGNGAPAGEVAPAGEQPLVEPPPAGEQPSLEESPVVMEAPGKLRVRLSHDDDVAIAGIQRALKLPSFGEASKVFYAMQQQAAPAAPVADSQQPAPTPQASATQELEAQIATLTAEMQAERENENTFTVEYQDKLMQLADLRGNIKLAKFQEGQRAQAQQQTREQEAGSAVNTSFEVARNEFPTVADPASPIRQAIASITAEWSADPATLGRLQRTDTPQMLAREAAERVAAGLVTAGRYRTIDLALASLKAAPAAPAAPAVSAAVVVPRAATPPAAPTARRVAPAPGSRSQQTPGQHQTIGAAVAATNDPAELERMFDEAAESSVLSAGLRRR